MTVRALPWAIQGQSHEAEIARDFVAAITGAPVQTVTPAVAPTGVGGGHGVVFSNDGQLAVTQNGTPNMSVNVAAGRAFIRNTDTGSLDAGVYVFMNDGTVNLAIAAADPTNPRRDLVVAQVRDSNYSGASNDARLTVVQGTPAGVPVDPTVPANSLVLARIAVAAAATSIVTANITDLRQRAFALGGGSDIQIFTASGTWTKPAWAVDSSVVLVSMVAGGGGGGAGCRGASGTIRCGGGGGGAGGYQHVLMPASALGPTEGVTVGSGGAGGPAQTSDSSAGPNGSNATSSVFGSGPIVSATAGAAGAGGGLTVAGAGGAGGNAGLNNGAGSLVGGGAGPAGSPSTRLVGAPGGGGAGGGIDSANTASNGGAGGVGAGGTAGTAGTTPGGGGGAGGATATNAAVGGSGGGGGAARASGGTGGAGGAGGLYGGGGGGGGASLNGNASGAGGAGANGIVVVITRQ